MHDAYRRSKEYSNQRLQELRAALTNIVLADCMAVTFGSYARREASSASDIDYLILVPNETSRDQLNIEAVRDAIGKIVPVDPSSTGAFGKPVIQGDMMRNLGGNVETNHSFTQRLLLLLEGEWLTNESAFKAFRRQLIERYVDATKHDHQLALFLLNDVIRYWRTMTVDYMYKTTEGEKKPWAVRNIKLVFSRKLMYASGLFSVATTVDRGRVEKIEILEKLFDMPVVERMNLICGDARMSKALRSYDLFLQHFEDPGVRSRLERIKSEDHTDPIFRKLKNEGHHFTRELVGLFERTFHKTHPIHRAVIF